MSDRFAQNRESRKHKVQRPRKEGQAGRVVQSQVAVVWAPNRSGSGSQHWWAPGNRGPRPTPIPGCRGTVASRMREPRDKEPADVEKDKGFQKQGVMPTKRDTTSEGQVWW